MRANVAAGERRDGVTDGHARFQPKLGFRRPVVMPHAFPFLHL
jgi:hypothetical protein